jgi:hypothetical protein
MANNLGTMDSNELTGMRYAGTDKLPAPPMTEPGWRENRFGQFVGAGHGAELQALHEELAAAAPSAAPMSPERKAELERDCELGLNRLERAQARGAVPPELPAEIKNNLGLLQAEAVAQARKIAEEQFTAIFSKRWLRQMKMYRDWTIVVWTERLLSQEIALAKPAELLSVGRRVLEHNKELSPEPVSPVEHR